MTIAATFLTKPPSLHAIMDGISGAERFTESVSRAVCVFLVEDVLMDRDVIRKRLNEWNVCVIDANSKEDAIRLAETRRFDLALVDMWLPWEGNGISVMKALRAKDEMVPICSYSNNFRDGDVAKICHAIGPVIVADKRELMEEAYLKRLFAVCRLARRAGMLA